MFLRHLNNLSSPIECRNFKCGTDWGLVASAGGGLIGGIIDALGARGTNHIQWRRTQGLQNDEQDFQAEQAELERQWQESMQQKYNDWQEGMYLKYQSPKALREQYEAAGLNPYMADTDARSLATSSPVTAPQGASAHGAGVPSLGAGHNSSVDFARSFSQIASAFKSLSESDKADADAQLVKRTMSDIIRKYALDNEAQTMANAVSNIYTKWMTSAIYNQDGTVSSTNAVRKFNAEYQKIMEEVGLLASQAKSANSQADLNDTINDLQQKLKPVYEKDKAVAEGIMARIDEYVKNIFNLQKMQIDTGYTNAAANYKQGLAAESNAHTNYLVGQSIIKLNKALEELHKAETHGIHQKTGLFDATYQEQISAEFDRLEQVGIVSKQMSVALQMAMKDRDWQQVEKILHAASTTASTLRDLGIGFSQISGSLPKSRNPIGFGAYGQ